MSTNLLRVVRNSVRVQVDSTLLSVRLQASHICLHVLPAVLLLTQRIINSFIRRVNVWDRVRRRGTGRVRSSAITWSGISLYSHSLF